jgi:hypothetical protein
VSTATGRFPVRHDPATGRFLPSSGGGSGGASPPAHGVGVTDDPRSLYPVTSGQREGESAHDYHDRLFTDGQEHYEPVAATAEASQRYRQERGLPEPNVDDWTTIKAPYDRLTETADDFEKLSSNPDDPETRKAYKDLVDQTNDQWHLLTDPPDQGGLGVEVEFVTRRDIIDRGLDPKGLNPYQSADEQADDVRDNHHLMIASLSDWPKAHHPVLDSSLGGEYDTFRAVHDAFGHTATGADFSRHGEYQAWLHHSSMFTGDARRAASTELTGENSFLVTRHRPAPHKAALLPDNVIAMPWDGQGNLIPNFWNPGSTTTTAHRAWEFTAPLSDLTDLTVPDPATATGADLARLDNAYAATGVVNPNDALRGQLLAEELEAGEALVSAGGVEGAMVAAMPSDATAPTVDPEVGSAHVTLCFLGPDGSAIDDTTRALIDGFVAEVAMEEEPVSATVAGVCIIGRDGAVALLLNSQALSDAHDELQAGLEDTGLCPPWSFDGFIPHLTLSYPGADPATALAEAQSYVGAEIVFDRLATEYAGDERTFPLEGGAEPIAPVEPVAQPEPAYRSNGHAFPVRHDPGSGRYLPGAGGGGSANGKSLKEQYPDAPQSLGEAMADPHNHAALKEVEGTARRVLGQPTVVAEQTEGALKGDTSVSIMATGGGKPMVEAGFFNDSGSDYIAVTAEPGFDPAEAKAHGQQLNDVFGRHAEVAVAEREPREKPAPLAVDGQAFPVRHDPGSGRFLPTGSAGTGGGGKKGGGKHLVRTGDVEVALKALRDGDQVELDQPREVSTLIDRLAQIGDEAKRLGERAPTYDLCGVSVKGTNLFCAGNKGIPRLQMPQLKGVPEKGSWADRNLTADSRGEKDLAPAYMDHLEKERGIDVNDETENPAMLRATQTELDGVKVAQIARALQEGTKMDGAIWVSKDNYVLDGHHRWAAMVANQYAEQGRVEPLAVHRVDTGITNLLNDATDFATERGLPPKGISEPLPYDPTKHSNRGWDLSGVHRPWKGS